MPPRLNHYRISSLRLPAILFLTSSVGMAVEMIGSRLLAPYLGTSINVWAALIGVILGCLSLGYWAGGRLSGHNPRLTVLAAFLLAASVFVALIPILDLSLLAFITALPLDARLQALLACILLFAAPTILMGAVTPYAIRLRLTDMESSGRAIGNLYSISTVGSIAGTLGTGFFLIQYLQVNTTLFILSGLLVLAALLAAGFRKPVRAAISLFLVIGSTFLTSSWTKAWASTTGVIDRSTLYNRVWIYPLDYRYFGKDALLMQMGNEWSSARFTDGDPELVFPYTKYYRLIRHFNPSPDRVLMIGGAGYSYPQDFLRQFPSGRMDVAEIDPGITALARQYFGLTDNPRLTIYHEDGRSFLNRTQNRYDAVLGDAFHSSEVPFQLSTVEAVREICDRLSPSGIVIMNTIGSIDGQTSRFLQAEYATYKEVFPQVYLLPVGDPGNSKTVQNIILLALKESRPPAWSSPSPELNSYLSHVWKGTVPSTPVLTDQLAPVERYMLDRQ